MNSELELAGDEVSHRPRPVGEAPRPYIVGLGGTTRPGSSSEVALRISLEAAERHGARTRLLRAADLDLPMYAPERSDRVEAARQLVAEVRAADGLIIATPGYHGGVSGLIKNALDYIEDLREAPHSYLDGRAVGCIVCASGWQGAVTTLEALRSIVHALRGWPTPYGVTLNSLEGPITSDGIADEPTQAKLGMVAEQVVEFATVRALTR